MIVSFKTLAKIVAPLALAAISSAALADAPDYVRVRNISYAGTGCPAGTAATNIAPDRQAFTLLFDQYLAQVGPGIPFSEKRKNCQLNVDLDFPQGWSYTLFTVDTRGYASLDQGVIGTEQSSYYFQGQMQTATLRTTIAGQADRDYLAHDVLGVSALVWSPCGLQRALNINTQVRVDNAMNPGGQGLMTVDSIDGQFKLIYGIKWQRCR